MSIRIFFLVLIILLSFLSIQFLFPRGELVAKILTQANFDPEYDNTFFGVNTSDSRILALRPLTQDIFSAHGNPTTNLGKARAIRDFIARTFVHPADHFHLNQTKANISVLPVGDSWADFNRAFSENDAYRHLADNRHWTNHLPNTFLLFDMSLGTLNHESGTREDDGMMKKIGPAQYRIRDYNSYKTMQCTWQNYMAVTLWASAGLHGMQTRANGHDPAAVFIPELKKWIWEDATYNEEYTADGIPGPLSPIEILELDARGEIKRVHPLKTRGPDWDMNLYANAEDSPANSYILERKKLKMIGGNLDNRMINRGKWQPHDAVINSEVLDDPDSEESWASRYDRVSARDMFPELGVRVTKITKAKGKFTISLKSNFPNHKKFVVGTRSAPESIENWQECSSVCSVPAKVGTLVFRSVDAEGYYGIDATLELINRISE